MVMNSTQAGQFKVTYLIMKAPLFGSLFLLILDYLIGIFVSRTLMDCRRRNSNVLKNFLKLKLLLILIKVLGDKVTDLERVVAYASLILLIKLFERVSSRRRAKALRYATDNERGD